MGYSLWQWVGSFNEKERSDMGDMTVANDASVIFSNNSNDTYSISDSTTWPGTTGSCCPDCGMSQSNGYGIHYAGCPRLNPAWQPYGTYINSPSNYEQKLDEIHATLKELLVTVQRLVREL